MLHHKNKVNDIAILINDINSENFALTLTWNLEIFQLAKNFNWISLPLTYRQFWGSEQDWAKQDIIYGLKLDH